MTAADIRSKGRSLRQWARLLLGYILFAGLLVYAVRQWPAAVWAIEPGWLLLCALPMLGLAVLQSLQVWLFLRVYDVAPGRSWIFEFAVRRGVLNAVIPGRLGTLIMMREMTRLGVRWQDYIGFSLMQALQALAVSLGVLAAVLLPFWQTAGALLALCAATWLLQRRLPEAYRGAFRAMFVMAMAIYIALLLGFWTVLRAMGVSAGPVEASYFGVLLNALAQVAITPGNMGVREALVGMMASYVLVPVSTGILASAVFQAVRIAVYSACILVVRLVRRS